MGSDTRIAAAYPCLYYRDAPAMLDWLCRAFGFVKRLVIAGDDGGVLHAELSLGNAVVMVGSLRGELPADLPPNVAGLLGGISITVTDPDAHYATARAQGAEIVREIRTEEYGARGYSAVDPEGRHWHFADYVPGQFWDGA